MQNARHIIRYLPLHRPKARVFQFLYITLLLPARHVVRTMLPKLLWLIPSALELEPEGDRPQVLLVAKSELAYYCCRELLLLLRNENCNVTITCSPGLRKFVRTKLAKEQNCRYVDLPRAIRTKWHSVCFPTHFLGNYFHPAVKKIYTGHGIEAGKRIYGGGSYKFGWKSLVGAGVTYYDKVVINTDLERNIIPLRNYRMYKSRLLLAGNPTWCALKESLKSAEAPKTCKPTIFIMSSWGPKSLAKTHLREIAEQLNNITSYRLVLSIHVNQYRLLRAGALEEFRKRGIEVLAPDEDSWFRAAAAADAVVSDMTSASIYCALLGKPVFYAQQSIDGFHPRSPYLRVYEASQRFSTASELILAMRRAEAAGWRQPDDVIKLLAQEFDQVGNAKALIAEIVG